MQAADGDKRCDDYIFPKVSCLSRARWRRSGGQLQISFGSLGTSQLLGSARTAPGQHCKHSQSRNHSLIINDLVFLEEGFTERGKSVRFSLAKQLAQSASLKTRQMVWPMASTMTAGIEGIDGSAVKGIRMERGLACPEDELRCLRIRLRSGNLQQQTKIKQLDARLLDSTRASVAGSLPTALSRTRKVLFRNDGMVRSEPVSTGRRLS